MREGEVVRTFRVDGADTIFRYPRLDHLSKGDSTRSAGGWHVRVCAGNLLRAGGPTGSLQSPVLFADYASGSDLEVLVGGNEDGPELLNSWPTPGSTHEQTHPL